MFRRVFAVLLGFITAFILVTLIQSISANMYPPPEDFITQDTEAMEAYFSGLPQKARLIMVLAHCIGCLGGAFIAARVADQYKFYLGILVGLIIIVASASYNLAIYSPIWIFLVDLILCALLSYFGARLGAFSRQKV